MPVCEVNTKDSVSFRKSPEKKGSKIAVRQSKGGHVLLSYIHNTKYIVGILQRGG